jgi:protein-S-isoprenylcysteine O-methyltransferase Ste14
MTFVKIGDIIPYKTLQWKRARFVFLMKTRHPTLIALRLNYLSWSLSWIKTSRPHTRSRSQSRRTLMVSRHCFSSSDHRWPHTTTLFDANRSQCWAAFSGLTEEKDAIFLLVSYRPSHINFLRDWSIQITALLYTTPALSLLVKTVRQLIDSQWRLLCQ